jgi:lysozyme family protein
MIDLGKLKSDCEARWARCQITPSRASEVNAVAKRLCAPENKVRFQGVSDRLAELAATDHTIHVVPWWFIAIVSEREYGPDRHGNQRWNCQLGQGDPLNQPSVHVPKGMGPYLDHPGDSTPGHDAWTRCCVDVLINSAPNAAKRTDWSIGGTLVTWILYNGVGYEAYHAEPSPYDWGATNIEQRGKYSGDGKFAPNQWDIQIGCAAMLKAMMAIDPSITFSP